MRYAVHTDPAEFPAVLEVVPLGHFVAVETPEGEVFHVQRVPGGWYLPGDVVVATGDVLDGQPAKITRLEDPEERLASGQVDREIWQTAPRPCSPPAAACP